MKVKLTIEFWVGEKSSPCADLNDVYPYGKDARVVCEKETIIDIDESEFPQHKWRWVEAREVGGDTYED